MREDEMEQDALDLYVLANKLRRAPAAEFDGMKPRWLRHTAERLRGTAHACTEAARHIEAAARKAEGG